MPVTVNGTTYTTKAETMEVFEALEEKYGIGTQTRPECIRERQKPGSKVKTECGATTEYVILKANPFADQKQGGFLGEFQYLPMRICLRCGAAEDGYKDGLHDMPKRPRTESLSQEDMPEFLQAYNAGWLKGRADRDLSPQGKDTSIYAKAAGAKQ